MQDASDYRSILKAEFESRAQKNPRYSLRSFAKQIGLSPGGLSQVFSGRMGLSRKTGLLITQKLSFSDAERELFLDLIDSCHARNKTQRELAKIRLAKYAKKSTLALESFRVISDWYHLAILELTALDSFRSSPAWIAKVLGIHVKTAEIAIDRLKNLGLLREVRGRLTQTEGFMATPSDVPSQAIREFHRQVLGKALGALELQSVDERDFSSTVIPISSRSIPEAKRMLKQFRRKFASELEKKPNKDKIYCLSTQFFNLQAEGA